MSNQLKVHFQHYPIIAAADDEHLREATLSRAGSLILMHLKVTEMLRSFPLRGAVHKKIFIHADLIHGLSGEKEALKFIKETCRPDGIVTTKGNVIRAAQNEQLLTILRVFLIDTESMRTAIENIRRNKPDAVEIMPGIAPSAVGAFRRNIDQPIISAGLIHTKKQIEDALQAGSDAVSLSKCVLWNYQRS
ncbi:MAG: glycerol-3-phosphate responsive antiterminator [Sporolactobacillus sp.]|jgi:glycerol uptake operon antiterminator|nr:glycerol-3-phosphate responsive antiterminator [Sporolactobacillus sp.]